MKLITQPNSWSCALASTAMLLDCSVKELVEIIGHDGSAVIHPHLSEPSCRKGVHMQEIIDACLQLGVALTPIEAWPVQTPDGINEYEITKWRMFRDSEDRLKYYIKRNSGLLVGMARKYWHVVAFDCVSQKVYDPNGRIYTFEECKLNLQSFWIRK